MTVGVVSERFRVGICTAVGLVTLGIALVLTTWELAMLLAWIVTAVGLLAWIWSEIWGLDAADTERVATREDNSRAAASVVIVGASVASLVAVMIGLHRATSADTPLAVTLSIASMATVVSSWLVVHTLFTLRYAHVFYRDAGGVEFPGGEPPDYGDFAYLAFTVGMTFQVADTDITGRRFRRLLLRHSMLSYLFGTAIIASTISVLAGLVI